jgi:hypothetical protein
LVENTEEKNALSNATYSYWDQFARGDPLNSVVEAKLYTDARILGELPNLGPYSFINTIATQGALKPAIVLRVAIHAKDIELPIRGFDGRDNFEHYHGGDYIDEMAALVALFLGIRVKAGPVDRIFGPHDRFGRPVQYDWKPVPAILPFAGGHQIPELHGARNLTDLLVLQDFPARAVGDTNALVKAARLYQQAVWIADADPALAWLLLVSAVESIAVRWAGDRGIHASEILEMWAPKVVAILVENSRPDLVNPISDALARYMQATRKFTDFLTTFAPSAPDLRPAEFLQFSFTPQNIRKAAQIIYGHRSESLHNGTAFPLPMCRPPLRHTFEDRQDVAFQEIPQGIATHAHGAVWSSKSTPMLLHTFAYIARKAIISWWNSATPEVRVLSSGEKEGVDTTTPRPLAESVGHLRGGGEPKG